MANSEQQCAQEAVFGAKAAVPLVERLGQGDRQRSSTRPTQWYTAGSRLPTAAQIPEILRTTTLRENREQLPQNTPSLLLGSSSGGSYGHAEVVTKRGTQLVHSSPNSGLNCAQGHLQRLRDFNMG